MRKTGLLLLVLCSNVLVFANNKQLTQKEYVEAWSSVAVSNMIKHKIPASITLAQGILESGFGNSVLAMKANNHFGIKCHDWAGEKFYMDDDAKDECFRKYAVASESFQDHSTFLTSRSRYASLFSLDQKDYKGWANGLKDAGYATNPKYPTLLIDLIEKLNLNNYDEAGSTDGKTDVKGIFAKKEKKEKTQAEQGKSQTVAAVVGAHQVHQHANKVNYVVAKKGDSFYQIAKEFHMGLWQLYKYNDFDSKKSYLEEGDLVFLQPKRKRAKGESTYLMDKNMTLRDLSQLSAIKLSSLMEMNAISDPDELVSKGKKLKLK